MDDPVFLTILLVCLATTLGLIRLCASLMPQEPQQGSKQ